MNYYKQQLRWLDKSSPHILLYTTYTRLSNYIFTISPLQAPFLLSNRNYPWACPRTRSIIFIYFSYKYDYSCDFFFWLSILIL